MHLSDFNYDQNSELYLSPVKEKKFSYSDGSEIENYILEGLKKTDDVSYESEKLLHLIKDWPTYYHLGHGRANIFRVLDLPQNSDVLELGCGCGAITRYLGEQFNSVDALEGSLTRAKITRQRCRNLKNVRVFCSNIDQIDFQSKYDIVTLIGVLEYAPIFFGKSPKDACSLLLESAKAALKKNGTLIIAIENKIGLKYWAGFSEEHTGKYYDGIHGYPSNGSPVTFSKTELQDLLAKAGLEKTYFYYCFPDYKFASTIFSDVGRENELYLHNWIDVPFKAYGLSRKYNLHEGLALRTLCQSGMLREMANSFVIVASETRPPQDWAAKKISGFPRKKQYQCITTLKIKPELKIEKERIYRDAINKSEVSEDVPVTHKICNSTWYSGDLLSFDIFESFFQESIKESVKKVLNLFHDHLMKNFFIGKTDAEGYPLTRKECSDSLLRNFVKHGDELKHIDTEWHSKEYVSIDYVLYRCITNDIIFVQYPGIKADLGEPQELIFELISSFYPKYNQERLLKNELSDRQFQTSVSMKYNPEGLLGQTNVFIDPVVVELNAVREELNTIYNSKSWKLILYYYKFRDKLFPPGTLRSNLYHLLMRNEEKREKNSKG